MEELSSHIKIFGRIRPPKAIGKLKATPGRYWVNPSQESRPIVGFRVPKHENAGMINNQREAFEFQFDRVFDVDVGQEEVFENVARPVIQSCLKGFNGTIFAYGQTGSGKTFTITGGAEKYADRGLIPRALQYVFREAQKSSEHQISVHVSYMEIYNENGYDLLDNTREAKKLEDLQKVTLMEDSDELIHLKNLRMVPAANEEEALNLLFVGDTNRMIAETPSNPSSSRSHCIFIISLTIRKEGEDSIRRSKLHLVDLAGSERVARTGIEGHLLKEAKYINLSLHYLEQVIIALHEQSLGKRSHIPYRNSMMTSVLRDSLGGNCMTTMIATIAVEDVLIDESISTCRFAQRVALISNKATLNEELDPSMIIDRLKKEIARLKAELAILRGESSDEPLPDYEIQRVKQTLDEFLADSAATAELVLSDFRKIQYAFKLCKSYFQAPQKSIQASDPIPVVPSTRSAVNIDSEGLSAKQVQQIDKMKLLIAHRDNEINILVGMITQLKDQIRKGGDAVPTRALLQQASTSSIQSVSSTTTLVPPTKPTPKPVPQLTTEKAKAFEIFKRAYASGDWIDRQKHLLKSKYTEAKTMGERANVIRNDIKVMKEKLSDESTEGKDAIRMVMSQRVIEYKTSYQHLKDLKLEIEHMQHLLEQARLRLTRDFEQWYVNVYLNAEVPEYPENESMELDTLAMTAPAKGAHAAREALKAKSFETESVMSKTDSNATIQVLSKSDSNASIPVISKTDSNATIQDLNEPERPRSSKSREAWIAEDPNKISIGERRTRSLTPSLMLQKPTDAYLPKQMPHVSQPLYSSPLRETGEPREPRRRIRRLPLPGMGINEDIDAFYKARQDILAKATESARSATSLN